MTSTVLDAKPLFNPKPDNIEYALMLIDECKKPFPEEINELQNGLELIQKLLDGMKIIRVQ
jgi:hypothetical protein